MLVEDEMLAFIKRKPRRWKELEEEFVKKRGYSKGKFVNHFKILKKTGKIKKRLDEETGRPIYYVPAEFAEEAEKAKFKEDIHKTPLEKVIVTASDLETIIKQKLLTIELSKRKEPYKAFVFSEVATKYESYIKEQFKEMLEEDHLKKHGKGELKTYRKQLEKYSEHLKNLFFQFIEPIMGLGIFSTIKLPPRGVSKIEIESLTETEKVELEVYTEIWQYMYNAILRLIIETIQKSGGMRTFLSETAKNGKITLILEIYLEEFSKGLLEREKLLFPFLGIKSKTL